MSASKPHQRPEPLSIDWIALEFLAQEHTGWVGLDVFAQDESLPDPFRVGLTTALMLVDADLLDIHDKAPKVRLSRAGREWLDQTRPRWMASGRTSLRQMMSAVMDHFDRKSFEGQNKC